MKRGIGIGALSGCPVWFMNVSPALVRGWTQSLFGGEKGRDERMRERGRKSENKNYQLNHGW